jgi:hypothetical protein
MALHVSELLLFLQNPINSEFSLENEVLKPFFSHQNWKSLWEYVRVIVAGGGHCRSTFWLHLHPSRFVQVKFQACHGNMYVLLLWPLPIHVPVSVRLFCIRAGCSGAHPVGICTRYRCALPAGLSPFPWEFVRAIVAPVADSLPPFLSRANCT